MKSLRPLLLHRYMVIEFLPPFGVGLLVFTFVLILHHLFLMMDLFLNRGVDIGVIAHMALLTLPMFFPLSVPMACLLGVLLSYGRLTEDGELTALRSGGCSLWQYGLPILAVAFFFSLGLVFFNLSLVPRASQKFKDLYIAVAQKNPLALFAPKVMNQFGEYKVIVNEMDRRKKKLSGISIYKTNPTGAPTRILAPTGELEAVAGDGLTLALFNGSIHQPNPEKNNDYSITQFNRFAVRIPEKTESDERILTPREMTLSQLRGKIREAIEKKEDVAPLLTENHIRIAGAFAPLVFGVLGMALGIQFKKGSKSLSTGLSIVIILIYYGLLMISVSFSVQGKIPPLVSTWIPNITLFALGAYFFRKLLRH